MNLCGQSLEKARAVSPLPASVPDVSYAAGKEKTGTAQDKLYSPLVENLFQSLDKPNRLTRSREVQGIDHAPR